MESGESSVWSVPTPIGDDLYVGADFLLRLFFIWTATARFIEETHDGQQCCRHHDDNFRPGRGPPHQGYYDNRNGQDDTTETYFHDK